MVKMMTKKTQVKTNPKQFDDCEHDDPMAIPGTEVEKVYTSSDVVTASKVEAYNLNSWCGAGLITPIQGGGNQGARRKFSLMQAITVGVISNYRKVLDLGTSCLPRMFEFFNNVPYSELKNVVRSGCNYLIILEDVCELVESPVSKLPASLNVEKIITNIEYNLTRSGKAAGEDADTDEREEKEPVRKIGKTSSNDETIPNVKRRRFITKQENEDTVPDTTTAQVKSSRGRPKLVKTEPVAVQPTKPVRSVIKRPADRNGK